MKDSLLLEIKRILSNPFNSIEEADAKHWLEYCEKDLLKSYKEYLGALERLKKITLKIKEGEGTK